MGALFETDAAAAGDTEGRCGSLAGCPVVAAASGTLDASFYEVRGGGGYTSNSPPAGPVLYRWSLRTPCQVDDDDLGACTPGAGVCAQVDGRVISLYYVDRFRLVQPGGVEVDGQTPPAGQAEGTSYGTPFRTGPLCVDVTDLNPGPTPEEVFRYFQTLPLPQLITNVQPPGGNVLVGLPTIFYTDAPTEQVFTVDIRGFTVIITATAEQFSWHTGDGGTTVESTTPGAAYPDQPGSADQSAQVG